MSHYEGSRFYPWSDFDGITSSIYMIRPRLLRISLHQSSGSLGSFIYLGRSLAESGYALALNECSSKCHSRLLAFHAYFQSLASEFRGINI